MNRGGRNVLRPYITDTVCNVPTMITECRWVRKYLSAFLFLHVAGRVVVTGNRGNTLIMNYEL